MLTQMSNSLEMPILFLLLINLVEACMAVLWKLQFSLRGGPNVFYKAVFYRHLASIVEVNSDAV